MGCRSGMRRSIAIASRPFERRQNIMAYKYYDTAQGTFCIDWDTCTNIIRSHHRSQLTLDYATEKRESQISAINPLSWGLPDLIMLTVDWDKVRQESEGRILSTAHLLAARAIFQKNGVDELVRTLRNMQTTTRQNHAKFKAKIDAVSAKAYREIEASIAGYQNVIDKAKLQRDLSGSVLIGLASIATGGAAALAVGSGAALKATSKYQDAERNAEGVAVIEATQTIITSVIPMSAAAKVAPGAAQTVKVIVSAVGDTSKAWLDGQSLGKAIAIGSVNLVTGPLGDKIKSTIGPIVSKGVLNVSVKVGQDNAKRFLQRQVKSPGTESSGIPPLAARGPAKLSHSLSVEDNLLLKLAIIDPAKGIGQSWW